VAACAGRPNLKTGDDMDRIKTIAVVAHDNCKDELLDFIDCNREAVLGHRLIATGTT